jgi:ankyrin repeat protein
MTCLHAHQHHCSTNKCLACCLLLPSAAAAAACLACAVLQAGLTALHYAAWQGSVDAVELLLEKGCNVNAADPVSVLTHSYTLSIQLLP